MLHNCAGVIWVIWVFWVIWVIQVIWLIQVIQVICTPLFPPSSNTVTLLLHVWFKVRVLVRVLLAWARVWAARVSNTAHIALRANCSSTACCCYCCYC